MQCYQDSLHSLKVWVELLSEKLVLNVSAFSEVFGAHLGSKKVIAEHLKKKKVEFRSVCLVRNFKTHTLALLRLDYSEEQLQR